jgi:hypothetical protein
MNRAGGSEETAGNRDEHLDCFDAPVVVEICRACRGFQHVQQFVL